ncbi:MAG: hypothetical protein AAF677_09220 [Pseudomonadota bacterium]
MAARLVAYLWLMAAPDPAPLPRPGEIWTPEGRALTLSADLDGAPGARAAQFVAFAARVAAAFENAPSLDRARAVVIEVLTTDDPDYGPPTIVAPPGFFDALRDVPFSFAVVPGQRARR